MATFTITVRPRLTFGLLIDGQPIGLPGAPGLSAYQVWLAEGNVGTEQDFFDSLKGPEGDTLWEADGLTTIKPSDAKTVDGTYISGTVYGGLFQP